MVNLKTLSNLQLHEQTKFQAGVVRTETTKLLHHLVEVERRRVFAEFGTSSLFDYCVRHLEMSHPCASRHVNSARMMREIPEIEEKIQTGELTLTSVSQAQVFFKREAKLAEVRRRTQLMNEEASGGFCNSASVDESRRAVDDSWLGLEQANLNPNPNPKKYSTDEKRAVLSQLANKSTREAEQVLLSLASEPVEVSLERVRAINETTTEIKFAADKETMANLERMREIWSHKMPGATFGELIKEMARVLVEQHDPLKKAERAEMRKQMKSNVQTSKTQVQNVQAGEVRDSETRENASSKAGSRDQINDGLSVVPEADLRNQGELVRESATAAYTSPAPDEAMQHRSRYISSAVRHAVYMRDGGACTHVDPQKGERCDSRYRIDLDHIIAFAKGGEATVENLRLRCRQHNLWYAIRVFGWKRCRQPMQI